MLLAEEVKRQKEMARRNSRPGGDEEPEWQSNLSSWKSRRRKQSEETLMRVAEIKTVDGAEDDASRRKMCVRISNPCSELRTRREFLGPA